MYGTRRLLTKVKIVKIEVKTGGQGDGCMSIRVEGGRWGYQITTLTTLRPRTHS